MADISNVKIFSNKEQLTIRDCVSKSHNAKLQKAISPEVQRLTENAFFRAQVRNLLQQKGSEQFTLRVENDLIQVKPLKGRAEWLDIDLSTDDNSNEDVANAHLLSKEIVRKANDIWQNHSRDCCHSDCDSDDDHSVSPTRSRGHKKTDSLTDNEGPKKTRKKNPSSVDSEDDDNSLENTNHSKRKPKNNSNGGTSSKDDVDDLQERLDPLKKNDGKKPTDNSKKTNQDLPPNSNHSNRPQLPNNQKNDTDTESDSVSQEELDAFWENLKKDHPSQNPETNKQTEPPKPSDDQKLQFPPVPNDPVNNNQDTTKLKEELERAKEDLSKDLQSLKSLLEQAANKQKRLENENKELKQQHSTDEKQLNQTKKQLSDANDENTKLNQQLKQKNEQLDKVNQQLLDANDKKSPPVPNGPLNNDQDTTKLKEELEHAKKDLSNDLQSLKTLAKQKTEKLKLLESENKELRQQTKQKDELEKTNRRLEEQHLKDKQALDENAQAYMSMYSQNGELKNTIQLLQDELTRLKQENLNLESELSQSKINEGNMGLKADDLEDRLRSANKILKQNQETIQNLELRIAYVLNRNTQIEQSATQYKEKAEQLSKELRTEIRDLQEQLRSLKQTLPQLQEQNQLLKQQNESLRRDNEQLRTHSDQLENENLDAKHQTKTLERQNSDLSQKNQDLSKTVELQNRTISDLVSDNERLENENKKLTNDVNDFSSDYKELNKFSDELLDQLKQNSDLSQKNQDLSNTVELQNRTISDLVSDKKRLEKENNDLKVDRDDLKLNYDLTGRLADNLLEDSKRRVPQTSKVEDNSNSETTDNSKVDKDQKQVQNLVNNVGNITREVKELSGPIKLSKEQHAILVANRNLLKLDEVSKKRGLTPKDESSPHTIKKFDEALRLIEMHDPGKARKYATPFNAWKYKFKNFFTFVKTLGEASNGKDINKTLAKTIIGNSFPIWAGQLQAFITLINILEEKPPQTQKAYQELLALRKSLIELRPKMIELLDAILDKAEIV